MHQGLASGVIVYCMIASPVNAEQAAEGDRATKAVKVTELGAIPDDDRDDTAAIRAAVERCVEQPGSRLVFAPGQYDVMSEKGLADWRRMITAAVPGKERWRGSPPQGWEGWPKDKNTILRIVGGKDVSSQR